MRLTPAPSLHNRLRNSEHYLEYGLRSLGWANAEARLPVYGHHLHTLVESSGNKQFVEEFVGVDQYGGWLSHNDAANLRSNLVTTFSSLSEDAIRNLPVMADRYGRPLFTDPIDVMANAYADALEMLETPTNENQALYLILDH